MEVTGEMEVRFDSRSENEGFARVAVAAFMTQMNPTLEEVEDVKTAVSEAVTNAIIHGYEKEKGQITITAKIEGNTFYIEIKDNGIGIPDIEEAMSPLFTTKPNEDRSGMGFVFMEAFMDEVKVESKVNEGTIVKMKKRIGDRENTWTAQSL